MAGSGSNVNSLRNVPLSDALSHLGDADTLFVRLALSSIDAGHMVLRSLVVDVVPQRWLDPADESLTAPWDEARRVVDSPQALLFCGWLRTETVLDWFRRPDDCGINLTAWQGARRESFTLPEMHDTVSEQQCPSSSEQLPVVPYPYTLYLMQPKTPYYMQSRDNEQIVGPDGEFFQSFRLAQAEVVFGVTDPNLAYRLTDSYFAVRVVDRRGWLREIRVLPDKMVATVAGTEVLGRGHVVVRGAGLNEKAPDLGHHVSVDLPPHIPNEVDVVLLGNNTVLDMAHFSSANSGYPHLSRQVIVEREDVFGYVAPTAVETPTYEPSAVIAAEDAGEPHPKVFISYSHDTPEHRTRVRDLADRLIREGVDCELDRYEPNPRQGWQRWMQDKIGGADYVLVVCTETYCRRFNGKEVRRKGLGAAWEGMIITQAIYEEAGDNEEFIPVLFSHENTRHIPMPLRQATHYMISDEMEYEKLYARLTGQMFEVKPQLGKIRPVKRRDE